KAKSDLLLNNTCEVFNGKIVGGRDKPVIILLEYIKEYCMKRIVNVQVPAGSVVPTGKDNSIVSTGSTKVVPASKTILFLVVLCLLRVVSKVS
ncbi:hypothetical protein Tco_1170885, partial [Tanacetum coccineum]